MKRIFIYKNKETNLIVRVDLHEKQKDVDVAELQKAICNFNSNALNKRYVEMIEIDSNIYEIICFLLNEKEYKEVATIEGIIEDISNVKDYIYDILNEVENIGLQCKKIGGKNGGNN